MPDVPMPQHITYASRAPYVGRQVALCHPEYPVPVVVYLLQQATATHANVQQAGGEPFSAPWEHVRSLHMIDDRTPQGTRLMNPKPSATSRLVAALDTARKEPKRPKATKGRDPAKILADIAEGRKVLAAALAKWKHATDNLKAARRILTGFTDELTNFDMDVRAEISESETANA